jgi:DNA-binding phage protein
MHKESTTESLNEIKSQNEIGTHEQLEWYLEAALESLWEAQRIDRNLYTVARFSNRMSSAVKAVVGCLDDAEILNRCGSLGSALPRDASSS